MMTFDDRVYDAIAKYLNDQGLPYKVFEKRRSPFMWLIYVVSFMWIWNRRFMSGFITTIAGRIYAPGDFRGEWRTLSHEGRHLKQAQYFGTWPFSIAYLFPLPLLLGVIGAFWSPWFLLFLLAAAPLSAPARVYFERQAYQVSAVCDALIGVDITSDRYLDYQVANHCGWAYYHPSWWRSRTTRNVRNDIARALRIVAGTEHDDYCTPIVAIVRAHMEAQ